MRRYSWCALLLVLPAVARTQRPERSITVGPGNTIVIGRVDSIWSPTLKEQRKVLIYMPPSYNDTTYLPQKYPVLYLLDGDLHFHAVSALVQSLGTGVNGTFVIPEMIVVAIPNTNRNRDLTPTRVDREIPGMPANQRFASVSGGMPNFFRFLRNELIPHIDSAYRTEPYRILVGHSLGGIAAINAMYEIPETFNAYVAIDPSIWWDDKVLLKRARGHITKPGLAGRALYVAQANSINPADSVGSLVGTHFSSIIQFNSVLESYNQSGLRYAYKYYPNDSHGSVPLIAEYDALRFIFAPYDVRNVENQPASFLTAHFAKASEALGYRVPPPERIVDRIGRGALLRDTTMAIGFFQLNAELYPNSPRVYEALGDVWMAKGDSAKAISFFEKSLTLRPRNQRVQGMIRRMREIRP